MNALTSKQWRSGRRRHTQIRHYGWTSASWKPWKEWKLSLTSCHFSSCSCRHFTSFTSFSRTPPIIFKRSSRSLQVFTLILRNRLRTRKNAKVNCRSRSVKRKKECGELRNVRRRWEQVLIRRYRRRFSSRSNLMRSEKELRYSLKKTNRSVWKYKTWMTIIGD